jgi:hypothetical protein
LRVVAATHSSEEGPADSTGVKVTSAADSMAAASAVVAASTAAVVAADTGKDLH